METREQQAVRLDADGRAVEIRDLRIVDEELFRILSDVPEPQLAERVRRALKVGLIALRDAETVSKVDFVERSFHKMQQEMQSHLDALLGDDGRVPRMFDGLFGEKGEMRSRITEVFGNEGELQRKFEEQYGPQGRVLAILDRYLGEKGELQRKVAEYFGDGGHFERRLKEYLGEGGNLEQVLDEFLGEKGRFRETVEEFLGEQGTLETSLDEIFGDKGKLKDELERHFGERGSLLYNLLDSANEESALGKFRRQLAELVDPNQPGGAFHDIKETMRKEFKDLNAKLETKKALDENRELMSHKGRDLETFVYETVSRLGAPLDDRVEHVGDQPGPLDKQGDVVVTVNPQHVAGAEVRVVFEVKNSRISLKGKNSIFVDIEEARRNRAAAYAVVVVRAKDAPAELGAFRVDPKGAIICAIEEDGDILPLEVAYKMARAEAARRSTEKAGQVDLSDVLAGLEKIRSKLEMIKGMKSGLTGAENSIQKVRSDLDVLRDDVREVLDRVTEGWGGGTRSAEPAA